jgi:hypothetical protein
MFRRAFMPWLHLDSTFALSSLGRLQKKCLKVLHGMTKSVIRSRKEQLLNSETQMQDNDLHDVGRSVLNGDLHSNTDEPNSC